MSSLNWPRIILCGLVAGVVFTLLSAVLVGALGSEFLAAAGNHASAGDGRTKTGPVLYFATISAGVWAAWLYAVVRPRSSNYVSAVIIVSFAWWIIASIQSLKWILLLGIPLSAWLPLAANLVPTVIAVFVGSALLGAVQPNQPLHPDRDTAARGR
jgi:peptidoglycan/LPS O-acetylase OafA/YrhL